MGFLDYARNDTKEMGSLDFAWNDTKKNGGSSTAIENNTERVIEKPKATDRLGFPQKNSTNLCCFSMQFLFCLKQLLQYPLQEELVEVRFLLALP